MGHDVHFLTRLERVEGPALNLALGLYRDAPLLKWTLERLPLPDGADVVALPLKAGDAPPYALVSRKGKFITCLGPGMQPGGTEVIRWTQLEAATRELHAMREVSAKGADRVRAVMRRMANVGPWLTREDFEDLQVIASINPLPVVNAIAPLAFSFADLRRRYRPRDFDRLTDRNKEILSKAWKSAWASSHAALVANEAMLHLEVIRPGLSSPETAVNRAMVPFALCLDGPMVRVGWALGRLGPPVLDILRQGLLHPDEAGIPQVFFYGLLALAVRFESHRPEVEDLLRTLADPTHLAATEGLDIFQTAVELVRNQGLRFAAVLPIVALKHLAERNEGYPFSHMALREAARQFYHAEIVEPTFSRAYAVGPPLKTPKPASSDPDIPRDMLYVAPFGLYGSILADPALILQRLHLMPALARQEASDLFYPEARRDALSASQQLTTPVEQVRDLLTSEHRLLTAAYAAQRPPPAPGRNETCTCGSGKKYKKCCGA